MNLEIVERNDGWELCTDSTEGPNVVMAFISKKYPTEDGTLRLFANAQELLAGLAHMLGRYDSIMAEWNVRHPAEAWSDDGMTKDARAAIARCGEPSRTVEGGRGFDGGITS